MCGGGIGKVINKVTSLHDKLDPLGTPIRNKLEDSLGVPRLNTIGTTMFGAEDGDVTATGAPVDSLTPETPIDSGSQAARDAERRRRAAAGGMNSTILGGTTSGTTTRGKSLLGQ